VNSIEKAKAIRIFNSVCPDIMFANNRIPRLNGLAKYEIISMGIKNVVIGNGVPSGKNVLKNLQSRL